MSDNSFGRIRWYSYIAFFLAVCLTVTPLAWVIANCELDLFDKTTGNEGGTTKPAVTTPEVTTPEVITPDVTTPETTTPEETPSENPFVTYTVSVIDENNAPLAGATVHFRTGEKSLIPILTNAEGIAMIMSYEADYTVEVTRAGYISEDSYQFAENGKELTVQLIKKGSILSELVFEPLCYTVGAGITEEVMTADVVSLLNIAEGTEYEIIGEVDFATPGKYEITCIMGKVAQALNVWVYGDYVRFAINGETVETDIVPLNYRAAAASRNFTNFISIVDSVGNPLVFTKDERSMRFENCAGSYVMYYHVTDAAGQSFSIRIVYDVTYDYNISVANGVAFTFDENAKFFADFDGATNIWLEDANGKVDPSLYQIEEEAIVLSKEYYNTFVGRKVAIKVCSEDGMTYFYVSSYDRDNYDEYLKRRFESLVSSQSTYVRFEYVEEAPDGIVFDYGYHYTKKAGPTVEQTALQFHTLGKYGTISFDLYVKDSYNTAGDTSMEFQIANGAKFASVVDSNGNAIPVNDKNNKPHVVLKKGETYHIVLNVNESIRPVFYIWGGRTVDLYYYNFEFGEPEFTYVINDALKTVVCYKGGQEYGYFAWPTVTKLDGTRLIAVSSGMRKAHIDTESKVVCWYSEDDGKTWSEPQVVCDTVLDDRDAGVVYWNGKIIVSWFCASKEYYLRYDRDKYAEWAKTIPDELDTKLMGGNYIISEDGGKTWSEIYNMPEGMFTPHGLIVNPDGGLTSVGYLKYDKVTKRWGTGIAVRTTTGEMDENGFVWSEAIVIADSNTQYSWDFQEPYGIYNKDGVLIVIMRADKGLYQCELQPGATEFSDWRKIADVQETPAHMFEHSSGVMVMTYGYRGIYYDASTGKTVSYTERKKDTTLGIRARLSYDGGLTWTREVILTHSLAVTESDNTSDWGYTSSVELSNGKILTLYYQRTGSETQASIYQVVWKLPEAITGEVTITLTGGKPTGDAYDGDGLVITTVSGQVGDAIELPTVTKEGYTFEGWYMDYACSMPFVGKTYCNDITLYAKWVKK
ncbi:MAG: InlB B-repeat-containing protein [Clostridia bacterium]|nr:InlB B-repeat-containing protein [Clostridia bacterium]